MTSTAIYVGMNVIRFLTALRYAMCLTWNEQCYAWNWLLSCIANEKLWNHLKNNSSVILPTFHAEQLHFCALVYTLYLSIDPKFKQSGDRKEVVLALQIISFGDATWMFQSIIVLQKISSYYLPKKNHILYQLTAALENFLWCCHVKLFDRLILIQWSVHFCRVLMHLGGCADRIWALENDANCIS